MLGLSNHVAINMNNHEYWILEHGQCLDLIIHVTQNSWILDFEQSTLFFLADGYTRYTMVAQRLFDRKLYSQVHRCFPWPRVEI